MKAAVEILSQSEWILETQVRELENGHRPGDVERAVVARARLADVQAGKVCILEKQETHDEQNQV